MALTVPTPTNPGNPTDPSGRLHRAVPERIGRVRHFLMCRPTYFAVDYAINPWMDPAAPVDVARAIQQWDRLRRTYLSLGHRVSLIDPIPGLPDMVFAANGAFVLDGVIHRSRFTHAEREPEAAAYADRLREILPGPRVEVVEPVATVEGEGDLLFDGRRILAGTGFRTRPRAHAALAASTGREVVGLELVDPRFYHLDTALTVLADGEIAYLPEAFSTDARRTLRRLYPDAVRAEPADAVEFGLNAVSDGRHVVLPAAATGLADRLRARGFRPIGVDVGELKKAGGGPKCCTLELRPAPEQPVAGTRRRGMGVA